jgi:peptide-methionine (R)-S-oxide reductase
MRKSLIYASAAALTALAWFGAFRPGPGGAERLLTAEPAEAALPGEEASGDQDAAKGTVRLFSVDEGGFVVSDKVVKSEEEWKNKLSPVQYKVLREKGTERAFTGPLLDNHDKGVYTCAACGADLFDSDTKFESGSGWPSFYAPIAKENVATEADDTLGMRRIEILCRRCGGHLGHVFDDGPKPTGLRYCVNSASLDFEKSEE